MKLPFSIKILLTACIIWGVWYWTSKPEWLMMGDQDPVHRLIHQEAPWAND